MKKYIDWIFWAFFIAGFLFGALKYSFGFPAWSMIVVGVVLGIVSSLLKKKLSKE